MLYLVLAGLAIHLDGVEVSHYGDRVIQASRLGPSIFPVVFAAIVGDLMRCLTLWKAQNRAHLGVRCPEFYHSSEVTS